MRYILHAAVLLTTVAVITTYNSITLPKTTPIKESENLSISPEVNITKETEDLQSLYIVKMQNEILDLWEKWYQDQNNWVKRKLRKVKQKWPRWAFYIARSIEKHENTPVSYREWKDDLTTLPHNCNAHQVLAAMAIQETKVNNSLVGAVGEVGILQCHPRWCLIHIEELRKL